MSRRMDRSGGAADRAGTSTGRLVAAVILALAFWLTRCDPGFAGPAVDEIEKKKQNLAAARKELQAGLEAMQENLSDAEYDQAEARKALESVDRGIAEVRTQLREIEVQLAKLRSPYDLVMALEKYRESGKTEAAFRELHIAFRGGPPSSGIGDYDIQAMIFELEARNKVVVPVGRALVMLGEIITKTVSAMVRGFGYPLGAMKELSARLAKKGAKAFIPKILTTIPSYVKTTKESLKKSLELESNKDSFMARRKRAMLAFVERLDVVVGVLNPEEFVQFLARKQALKNLERFNKDIYGVDDRAAAEKEQMEVRDELEAKLKEAEPRRAPTLEALKEIESCVAVIRSDLSTMQDAFLDLDRVAEELDADLNNARTQEQLEAFQKANRGFGSAIPFNVSLWFAKTTLAADDATAGVLGLRRETPVEVSGNMGSLRPEPCTYGVTTKSGERLTYGSTRMMWSYLGVSPILTATLSGPSGFLYSRGSLRAARAGKVRFRAHAPGVTRFGEAPHPCGGQTTIQTGTLRSEEAEIRALRVTDVSFSYSPERFVDQGRADFFFGERDQGNQPLTINAKVSSSDGEKTESQAPANPAALTAYLIGSEIAFVRPDSQGLALSVQPIPGKANLQLGLRSEGQLLYPKKLEVNSHLVKVRIDPPILRGENPGTREYRVPIGRPLDVRLVVEGGAGMTPFRVRWESRGGTRGFVHTRTSNFSHLNGRWTATCQIQFTAERTRLSKSGFVEGEALLDEAPVFLGATIERLADSVSAYSTEVASFRPALPVLRKIDLALMEPDPVKVARVDLFFPPAKDGPFKRVLALIGDFETIGECVFPLMFGRASLQGTMSGLFLSGDSLQMNLPSSTRVSNIGSRDTGSGYVSVLLEEHRVAPRMLLTEPVLHDQFLVTTNKLDVARTEKGYQLRVYGPADLQGYRAEWRFSAGEQMASSMTSQGGRWSSEVQNRRMFMEVRLINPFGIAVGKVTSIDGGQPLVAPSVRLEIAGKVGPGGRVVIRALVENLHFGSTGDFVAAWDVDPRYGSFLSKETRVINMGTEKATAVNTLAVSAGFTKDLDGVPINVTVYRLVGGGRR